MNIVTQMQELADTFSSDKQSSINDENRLQEMFDKLYAEKTEPLNTLVAERDGRQKVLNHVNEAIAVAEGSKASAEGQLADEQAYLQQITKSCSDEQQLYESRTADRLTESTAVTEAKKVLEAQTSFVELGASTERLTA